MIYLLTYSLGEGMSMLQCVCVWRSENNFQELFLGSHLVEAGLSFLFLLLSCVLQGQLAHELLGESPVPIRVRVLGLQV